MKRIDNFGTNRGPNPVAFHIPRTEPSRTEYQKTPPIQNDLPLPTILLHFFIFHRKYIVSLSNANRSAILKIYRKRCDSMTGTLTLTIMAAIFSKKPVRDKNVS